MASARFLVLRDQAAIDQLQLFGDDVLTIRKHQEFE